MNNCTYLVSRVFLAIDNQLINTHLPIHIWSTCWKTNEPVEPGGKVSESGGEVEGEEHGNVNPVFYQEAIRRRLLRNDEHVSAREERECREHHTPHCQQVLPDLKQQKQCTGF